MSIDDFWILLCAIRTCDGFEHDDLCAFGEAFDFFSEHENGRIMTRGVDRALRWLGLRPSPISAAMEEKLLEEVDLCRSGYLNFVSYLRLIRHVRECEVSGYEK